VKRFDIISEADARALTYGETVLLARGGHVTPLAEDTLRERRVVLIREGKPGESEADLVPVAAVRTVAIGSDHVGAKLRRALVTFLRARALTVTDLGVDGPDAVDYPDVAAEVAREVSRKSADAGIVVDGAGIGSAIAANKIPGIRAAMAATEVVARYSREHNGANVLTLGATLIDENEARAIVDVWLSTTIREPRYIRRLAKIRELERP
jgi:ribose 5-phosphate isomerase B